MTVIQPNVVLHDAHGHLWRAAPDYQDREPNAPGWLLLQREDKVEMPYALVLDVFGYGSDGNRYLLGRYDHAVVDRLAANDAQRKPCAECGHTRAPHREGGCLGDLSSCGCHGWDSGPADPDAAARDAPRARPTEEAP